MTDIDYAARLRWDYMLMHQTLKKCDAILLLGNRDDRTGDYAAKLFLDGYGDRLIISGGSGRLAWDDASSEAEHFAQIAAKLGVPREKMILEDRATNTGQNITFTFELLRRKKLSIESLLLVQKPYAGPMLHSKNSGRSQKLTLSSPRHRFPTKIISTRRVRKSEF